jgi:hypothetical protein
LNLQTAGYLNSTDSLVQYICKPIGRHQWCDH